MKAAAEVQKQVGSLREWVVREWTENQVQFWAGNGSGSRAGDGFGGRPGLSHSPPEVIESSPQLTSKPVGRSDFLMGKPAQIGYLDDVVVGGAKPVALFLVEEADGDAIESALKAKQGLGGDVPNKEVVAPLSHVVADHVSFVVLLDTIALLGIVQEVRKV